MARSGRRRLRPACRSRRAVAACSRAASPIPGCRRDQALEELKERRPDIVLLDLRLPPHEGDITAGKEILAAIREAQVSLPVIIMTGEQDREIAVEMISRGATDFFRKPVDMGELQVILQRALRIRGLEQEVRRLRSHFQAGFGIDNLVGRSQAIQDLVGLVRKVADSKATILIQGESGTGKELIARALHQQSSRRDGPFVTLNCACIPAGLIDSELFGHEKGAFTGADERRQGKFEFASGGTLFLDEVGDLLEGVQTRHIFFHDLINPDLLYDVPDFF